MAKEGYLVMAYGGPKDPIEWLNSKVPWGKASWRHKLIPTLVDTIAVVKAMTRKTSPELIRVILFSGDTPLWELHWKQMLKEEPEVGNVKG